MKKFILGISILTFAAACLGAAPAGDNAALPESDSSRPDRWSSFLPLMADEAYERGHDLPLPFGAGINFITLKRGIDVKEIKVSRNGNTLDVTDFVLGWPRKAGVRF